MSVTDYGTDPDFQPAEPEKASALRQAAEDGRAARAEAEALKRENAFLKADLGIDAKQMQVLAKAYDGANDPEAVRRWAEDNGFLTVQNKPAVGNTDALAQIAALGADGGSAPDPQRLTPEDAVAMGATNWLRFSQAHPHLAEQLKRGEEVLRPNGW